MTAPQSPQQAGPTELGLSGGVALIAAERNRQISDEGWTAEHDDRHRKDQLAWAAVCYAAPETIYRLYERGGWFFQEPWPIEWVPNVNRGEPGWVPWRRPEVDRIRALVKAGALIAAEIDRIQRNTP